MLHRALAHLEKSGTYVIFDKLTEITDYLTERPQLVRLENCVSGTLMSSTGATQGTVLVLFPFTSCTADFKYHSESCHIQKHSDDTAIVVCFNNGQNSEYKDPVKVTKTTSC